MEQMERITAWLKAAEAKLDDMGKPAWIAAMVVGFIVVWPLGLAILFYMIWSGRMGKLGKRNRGFGRKTFIPTGNYAFDAYREETLRRLEDEQAAFEQFLEKLRQAKDQSEFEQFMDKRHRPSPPPAPDMDDAVPA
ncbi:MAG: hypothetical protein ACJAVR_001153 [Paracoccaceae bacterium]|jgi:hypothetical protein